MASFPMDEMMHRPSSVNQLLQRIEYEFGKKYNKKQVNKLAIKMRAFFTNNQFDEWQDIEDDIMDKYDDCCCKEIIYKHLNITNIKQKQNEYLRLKQCLDHQVLINISQSAADTNINNNNNNNYNNNYQTQQFINNYNRDNNGCINNNKNNIIQSNNIHNNNRNAHRSSNPSPPSRRKKSPHRPSAQSQYVHNKHIKRINGKIMQTFSNLYNKEMASKIVNIFVSILTEQKYEFENVMDDVEDIENSEILSKIAEEISIDNQYHMDIKWIQRQLQNIIAGNRYFDIFRFDFNTTEQDVKYTESVVDRYQNIYPHSQSLINAKTVDIKNSKPILFWLLNLYSKHRSIKYRDNILDANMGYNSNDWWLENTYCRWIERMYPNQARHIKMAILELTKRALPVINYNSMIFPAICDRLNDFAQYALAFYRVGQRIKTLMSSLEFVSYAAPIQIDYWFIPQMTRFNRDINPMNPEKKKHKASYKWDIKSVLYHHKLGSIADENCLVEYATPDSEQLPQQLFYMIDKYQKKLNMADTRRNKYVFIIDRRRPDTVTKQNCSIQSVIQSKKPWPDTIYLLRTQMNTNDDKIDLEIEPDKAQNADKLPADWQTFPELGLALSKNNILHIADDEQSPSNTLGDALNICKFGFSYHILGTDNVSIYWHCNYGGTVFELSDMQWAFPRWFEKVYGKEQQLDECIIQDIIDINKHERLSNIYFEEFEKQVNMLDNANDTNKLLKSFINYEKSVNEKIKKKSKSIESVTASVQDLKIQVIELERDINDTIRNIKIITPMPIECKPSTQRLIFAKELKDTMTLRNCNIINNSSLYLVLSPCIGCFVENTKVLMSTMKEMSIKDIKIGDKLLTFNLEKQQQEIHSVEYVCKYQLNELIKVTFDNGLSIKCTVFQPFYVPEKQKWCCIDLIFEDDNQYGKLCVGDTVINNELEMIKITSISTEFINDATVYAIHLDKIHTFYANGILVHNVMQIFINTKAGEITLDVQPTDTIGTIKTKIKEQLNVPIQAQKLFHIEQSLADDQKLEFYNIQNQAILQLNESNIIPSKIHHQPFGSDASTMHISRKLTTQQIPRRVLEKFVNILQYMKTFAAVHGKAAVLEFKYEEKMYRIINYGFHCSKSGEILYVMMEGQCISNQIKWEMNHSLFTEKAIYQKFPSHAYELRNKLPSAIKLTRRFQDQFNMKSRLLQLLSNEHTKESIIEKARFNSRRKIPIIDIESKTGSHYFKLSKHQLEKRIISHFPGDNDVILIPIIRSDQGSYCLQYVWIVQLDPNVFIGMALRLNQVNDNIDISGIYVNICDEHQLIPHKYKCNECESLHHIEMPLTNIIIENNRNNTMRVIEQKNDEWNCKLNEIRLLKERHYEDAQIINTLRQKNDQICHQYTQQIATLNSNIDGLRSEIDQLDVTKLKSQNENLIRINNYYYYHYVQPQQFNNS